MSKVESVFLIDIFQLYASSANKLNCIIRLYYWFLTNDPDEGMNMEHFN